MMKRKEQERHGLTRNDRQPVEYQIWAQIIQRCLNPRNKKYPLYGGRGVRIAEKWRRSYVTFLKDVGKRPSRNHFLGRVDPHMGYCPGNVRWMSQKELARHKTTNRIVRYEGKEYVLADLAEKFGVDRKRLQDRLESGFQPKEAVELPVEGGSEYYTFRGQVHNIGTWAKILKMPYETLHSRLTKMLWPVERAFTEPVNKKEKKGGSSEKNSAFL